MDTREYINKNIKKLSDLPMPFSIRYLVVFIAVCLFPIEGVISYLVRKYIYKKKMWWEEGWAEETEWKDLQEKWESTKEGKDSRDKIEELNMLNSIRREIEKNKKFSKKLY